jgi:hypothetical protein
LGVEELRVLEIYFDVLDEDFGFVMVDDDFREDRFGLWYLEVKICLAGFIFFLAWKMFFFRFLKPLSRRITLHFIIKTPLLWDPL